MATPPLPDVPCVRCRLIGNEGTSNEWGNRLYLSYSGSAPSGANCATLASDISSAWGTHLAQAVNPSMALEEVDVLDIATDSGLSGQWTGNIAGSEGSGSNLPSMVATNVEFGIARRYRGGKPRIYLPPPTTGMQTSGARWSNTFVGDVNTWFAAFIAQIEALSIGSMGTLQHVNLSFYKGYTNITNPGQRAKAVPTYRATALHDNITGYSCKVEMGSQRRRRTSTTP